MTHPPSIRLLTALWNLWQSLTASGAARLRDECGLDLKEFIAAGHLQERPFHPAELAGAMQMPRYEVSRLLGRMQERGLVARKRHAGDGRQVQVTLTPAGHAAWRKGLEVAQSVTAPYLSGLTSAQCEGLIRTLIGLQSAARNPTSTHPTKENP